jgi:chorismate-pyruvate lyase
MTIMEFLADYGSTTGHFKSWSDDYRLEVLEHGVVNDIFQRLVVIFVDKIPVMLGLSETNLANPTFLDILQNAGVTPIGLRLFAPNAGIKRIEPEIGLLDTQTITNQATFQYLANANVAGMIYFRQSNFVVANEVMTLKEYILPGLVDVLAQNT